MARGSKAFRPADVSESNASSYPEPFREGQRKRYTRRLGDHAGLKNYGVNLVRVLPDGQSSARHTHSPLVVPHVKPTHVGIARG